MGGPGREPLDQSGARLGGDEENVALRGRPRRRRTGRPYSTEPHGLSPTKPGQLATARALVAPRRARGAARSGEAPPGSLSRRWRVCPAGYVVPVAVPFDLAPSRSGALR